MRGRQERYAVWRQDDNGQRFRIAGFSSREEGERCIARLTRTPHKQLYWIEDEGAGAPPEC